MRQRKISEWTCNKPFIAGVPSLTHPTAGAPTNARQPFTDHLTPYGTPLPLIHRTKFLRVIFQNTRHSFQLRGDGIDMSNFIANIQSLGAQMVVPISPNINWFNKNNWSKTKQVFRALSQHIHLSAVSSHIGLQNDYFHTSLIGSTAIITMDLWSSKVSHRFEDPSGHGFYCVTTIQGKNKKQISFIAAYIAVQKGSNIGVESLFAQQVTINEHLIAAHPNPSRISSKFCPRKDTIKWLNELISDLQKKIMQLSSC